MSLQSELTRLQDNVTSISSSKDAIMTALAAKGVTVPSGATLHDVPRLIGEIDGMSLVGHVTIGGRTYKTVKIGTQEWMAENLDYKFQVNGITIPIGASGIPSNPAAWYFNNNETDYGIDGTYKCGLLYNQYAAKYLDDNKTTLLPDGWHVPTNSEYESLIVNVGSNSGMKLKSLDNSVMSGFPNDWNGTDDYAYNGLPCGRRDPDFAPGFSFFGLRGTWWTSIQDDSNTDRAYFFQLVNDNNDAMIARYNKYLAFSLRLVKDAS